jgi:hypothetical protein
MAGRPVRVPQRKVGGEGSTFPNGYYPHRGWVMSPEAEPPVLDWASLMATAETAPSPPPLTAVPDLVPSPAAAVEPEIEALLVCTPGVRERLEAIDAGDGRLPPWADRDLVTDAELARAVHLRFVVGGDTYAEPDAASHAELLERADRLGFTSSRVHVTAVEVLEHKAEAKVRAEIEKQQKEDDRAERIERARRRAVRMLNAEELADDITEPVVATFAEENDAETPEQEWVIDGLLVAEGRVMLSASKKSGKTTLVLNLLKAMVTEAAFLGLYPVSAMDDDKVACWLNLELTRTQAQRWIKRLGLTADQGKRLVAVHLRGSVSRFNLTSVEGRAALVELLRPLGVQRLVVDPVAVLMAASGLNNADDLDVARFMLTFDRIAAEVGISEVVYIHHVGKGVEEGKEAAKGSTRWEDAVDAIWLMGFARDTRQRWFRAEGRDVEVAESPLAFDPETLELTIAGGLSGVGRSRRSLTTAELTKRVYEVVTRMPGISKGALRGHPDLGVRVTEADAAIAQAISNGWVRTDGGDHGSIQHWPVSGT